MKRPMATIGFAYLAAMCAAAFLSTGLDMALAVLFLAAGAVAFFALGKRRAEALAVLTASAAAFAVMGIYLGINFYPALALDGMEAHLTGVVKESISGRGRGRYVVETDSIEIEGAPQKLKITLSGWEDYDIEPFDRIDCRAKFFVKTKGASLGELLFDRTRGIAVYGGFSERPTVTFPENYSFEHQIYRLREVFKDGLREILPGWRSELLAEMLLGTRGEMEESIKADFRGAGMSHILAISGMHMVVLAGTAEKMFAVFGMKKRLRSAISGGVVLAYMVLTGMPLTVLRAGIMLLVKYFGGIIGEKSDSLNSLGLALVAVLIIDPLAAVDAGFLMSVLGSLGIVVLAGPLAGSAEGILGSFAAKKPISMLVESLAVSVAAWSCTLPVSALTFHEASLAAPLANIFAGPVSFLVISFGMLTMLTAPLGFLWPLALGFGWLAGISCSALALIAKTFSAMPFASVSFAEPWLLLWLFGAAALFLLPPVLKQGWRYVKYSALLAAVTLLFGALSSGVLMRGVTRINIEPLAEGCAVLCSRDGSAVLITDDLLTGDMYNVKEPLDAAGATELFVSLGTEDAAAELELARKYAPLVAMMSAPAAERYEGAVAAGACKAQFWGGERLPAAELTVLGEGLFGLDLGGAKLLYISANCDIMKLPAKFRKADIVILAAKAPENAELLRCEYLVAPYPFEALPGARRTLDISDGAQFYIRGENIRKG